MSKFTTDGSYLNEKRIKISRAHFPSSPSLLKNEDKKTKKTANKHTQITIKNVHVKFTCTCTINNN